MTPEAIIQGVERDGVRLALSPTGTIKARGDEAAVSRWLPIIREQKRGIVAALQSANNIIIESAAPNARPIYWETGDGRILGPAVPDFLAQVGSDFWIVTTYETQPRWIRSDRLRSRKAFEEHAPLMPVEPVREPK